MASSKPRQLGFTFLLFVPIIAYWGYGYWIRWYNHNKNKYSESSALTETVRHAPHGDSAANDTQQDAVDATQSEPPSLTADAYRTAFTNIANDFVTTQDSLVLTTMLRSADTDQLDDGLMLTMKLSVSSTKNKTAVFESGVAKELVRIVKCQRNLPSKTISLAINAINNLSLSDIGQVFFKDVVSDLVDTSVSGDEQLSTMSLQCLTNLSVTASSHENFTRVIQCLYNLMDSKTTQRLNVCRLLVNLSSNSMLVPYMLAAKCPACSMPLITGDEDIALRWLRVLVNITAAVNINAINESALPTVYKAPSPETMYAFLYGRDNQNQLSNTLLGNKSKEEGELNSLTNSLYRNIQLRILMPSNAQ